MSWGGGLFRSGIEVAMIVETEFCTCESSFGDAFLCYFPDFGRFPDLKGGWGLRRFFGFDLCRQPISEISASLPMSIMAKRLCRTVCLSIRIP